MWTNGNVFQRENFITPRLDSSKNHLLYSYHLTLLLCGIGQSRKCVFRDFYIESIFHSCHSSFLLLFSFFVFFLRSKYVVNFPFSFLSLSRVRELVASNDPYFVDFLLRTLNPDPKQRMSAEEALCHPFLSSNVFPVSIQSHLYICRFKQQFQTCVKHLLFL